VPPETLARIDLVAAKELVGERVGHAFSRSAELRVGLGALTQGTEERLDGLRGLVAIDHGERLPQPLEKRKQNDDGV
jgi:hypothetical protein